VIKYLHMESRLRAKLMRYGKLLRGAVFHATPVIMAAAMVLFAPGCNSAQEKTHEDGITLGEGRIEDAPTGEDADNSGRIVVDPNAGPKKPSPEEEEKQRLLQADLERRFRSIIEQADKWAEDDREWLKARLAEADAKLSEGNLTAAEQVLNSVMNKFPGNPDAAKKMLEITRRRSAAAEIEKTNEEKIIELITNADKIRKLGFYSKALEIYKSAGQLLEREGDSPVAVRLKPNIERNIKELSELLSIGAGGEPGAPAPKPEEQSDRAHKGDKNSKEEEKKSAPVEKNE